MITEKQYLESKISDTRAKNQNLRRIIQNTFSNRECFTFVRPVLDEQDLQKLGDSQ